MSWSERHFGQTSNKENSNPSPQAVEEQMSPGLTGEYDSALREKAAAHQPPPPPEYMGLEGEYDEQGLAKRVVKALDQEPNLDDIESLHITQKGSTIVLEGSAPSEAILSQVKEVAAKVDGTEAVDSAQVTIAA